MAEPTPTVYSYFMPEVEGLVTNFQYQQGYTGPNMTAPKVADKLKQNYDPGLDDLHFPLLEKYQTFARSEGVIGLETFKHSYFTNGSSEGIFHIMQDLEGLPIYQLEGEYQGYEAFAEALNPRRSIKTFPMINGKYYPDDFDVKPGIFILSNPSARDGNILPRELYRAILDRHQVVLDLAYMGATQKPLNLDMTHPNIRAVVASMSKPFGLYYFRIGFCWTRDPVASLYGNRWFKNAHSILLAEYVLDNLNMPSIKGKYFRRQEAAVNEASIWMNAPEDWIKPSDTWLLAHCKVPTGTWGGEPYQPFKRADDMLRFCLTPYYMEADNAHA